jgi:hypothetical protein
MKRHWHRDLAQSTAILVEAARFERTKRGLQVIVELIAYPKGHVNVAVSRVSGSAKNRRLVQDSSLMFNDVDEAKDALDAIADRLAREAGALAPETPPRDTSARRDDLSRGALEQEGFTGFMTFAALRSGGLAEAPASGGVYLVYREDTAEPAFLDENPGGRFKGRDPTELVDVLSAKWVPEAQVIYIGKGDSLRRRLKQFADFGTGKPIGHWGGRYIWQLAGSAALLVAWREAGDEETAAAAEEALVEQFKNRYDRLPFANIADPSGRRR